MRMFAAKLREVRELTGLSQYALAKKSGLTKQAISLLEMGDSEPTWQTVQLLAGALGVDCSVFVDPSLQPPEEEPPRPRGRPRKDASDQAEDKPASEKPAAKKGKSKK